MPRVHFTADFDWSPRPGVTIAYKRGHRLLVTTRCAAAAVAAGRAERIRKDDADGDETGSRPAARARGVRRA